MRESTRWTVKYQFGNIFLVHLEGLAVAFVFLAAAFYGLMLKSGFREVLSVIFIIVYFGMIYARAHKFAVQDKKTYTSTNPSMVKALLMGVMISATYLLALIIYKAIWVFQGVDGTLTSVPGLIYSAFFWMYTIPYGGIMGLAHGEMMLYSKIAMLAVPIAATLLGYGAGLKGINLMDKIGNSVYESDKNK